VGDLRDQTNRLTWQAFHFLPGNGGLPAGADPPGGFIEKLVCTPGSPVARDMVRTCIAERDAPRSLHRLGITMHTYADTWAHQGFAGILNDVNKITDVMEISHEHVLPGGLAGFRDHILRDTLPPVGHGRALTLPDLPFLNWQYRNGEGTTINRDNTAFFLDAANALHTALQRYRAQDPDVASPALSSQDEAVITDLFTANTSVDPDPRHEAWIAAVGQGRFSFGPATIHYDPTGPESWKAAALGTSDDEPKYPYHPEFLQTHWKWFHDALQRHRLAVLHDILPKYGICSG